MTMLYIQKIITGLAQLKTSNFFVSKIAVLAGLLIFLSACSHTSKVSRSAEFHSPKEQTWEALIYVLKSYPTKIIDRDKGYIETEELIGNNYWKAPHQKQLNTSGSRAVIKAQLTYKKPYSRVDIQKIIYMQSDFFSAAQEIPSDTLEEQKILYRVKRELYIKSEIKNFSKR